MSRDPLDPLAPPVRSLERVREILGLVQDLTVAKLHDAHRVCWSPLVGDDVFGDPEITFSEDSPDVETRRLARMMASQCLQVNSPDDSLTRLRVFTDGIVCVDIVFRVRISDRRSVPVRV